MNKFLQISLLCVGLQSGSIMYCAFAGSVAQTQQVSWLILLTQEKLFLLAEAKKKLAASRVSNVLLAEQICRDVSAHQNIPGLKERVLAELNGNSIDAYNQEVLKYKNKIIKYAAIISASRKVGECVGASAGQAIGMTVGAVAGAGFCAGTDLAVNALFNSSITTHSSSHAVVHLLSFSAATLGTIGTGLIGSSTGTGLGMKAGDFAGKTIVKAVDVYDSLSLDTKRAVVVGGAAAISAITLGAQAASNGSCTLM